jgi:hypothetical protein
MKGSGRSYGLSAISRWGEAIEHAAHQHDATSLERLLAELDGYLSRLKIQTPAEPL